MKNLDLNSALEVWKIPLAISEQRLSALFELLSAKERIAAERFRFEWHRRRYIVAHGGVRVILGRYINTQPHLIEFKENMFGKPYVSGTSIHFNLSHSEELAVLAVSGQFEVGIDIEHLKPEVDTLGIAERFFHPGEYQQLLEARPEERKLLFYYCWTAKEAFLKAKGVGIANHLQSFYLNFKDPNNIRVPFTTADFKDLEEWAVYTYQPDPGLSLIHI